MTFDPMSVEITYVTLSKDHCVQVPWQYINVCGYSDQFCKIPHTYYILRTYYLHTTDILRTYYVQNEWSHSLLLNSVQARQKRSNYIITLQSDTDFLLVSSCFKLGKSYFMIYKNNNVPVSYSNLRKWTCSCLFRFISRLYWIYVFDC